jgi:hypothetical protein
MKLFYKALHGKRHVHRWELVAAVTGAGHSLYKCHCGRIEL